MVLEFTWEVTMKLRTLDDDVLPVSGSEYLRNAAKRGHDFLNERMPTGWQKGIDLDRLNIGRPDTCMLAQLAVTQEVSEQPSYAVMRDYLGLKDEDCSDLGFSVSRYPTEGTREPNGIVYQYLTGEWRKLLTEDLTPAADDGHETESERMLEMA
ncbi:MAG: hypothetical protein AAB472_01825 [Patescibacteria group bacterium]